MYSYGDLEKIAQYVKSKLGTVPEIAIILGSGLGPLVDDIKNSIEIDYEEIPGFPLSTVQGHAGKLVCGEIGNKPVIAMKGRFHYYEGYDISQVVIAIRVFKLLGISNLLVTNAAGGINKSFSPGDLMIIRDHISFFAPSPLRGKNFDEFGVRFPDMSEAYSKKLIDILKKASEQVGVKMQEGVYAFTKGPMYETPSEIKALGILGADAVGMSTVPEVITARHVGMNVMGISCITNMAAGILDQPLNHEEVMQTAKMAERNFTCVVKKVIDMWSI